MKNDFAKTNSPFPIQAEDLVRERFQYRREFAEMEARQRDEQQVAEALGSGKVMKSITDEIVDSLENPRSEIMDIDLSQYATTKETVVPREIQKYYESRQTFLSRISGLFRRLIRR